MKKTIFLIAMSVFLFSCAEKESGGKYLAKVNNVFITEKDVTKEVNALPPEVREMFLAEANIEEFVEELVKKELLYQEAMKKGVGNSEEFKKKVEDFRKVMMIQLLLEDVIEEKTEVTDKEVKEFYEKNKSGLSIGGKKGAVDFEKVKGLIRQRLIADKQREIFDSYMAGLKDKYKVEVNKEAIARLSNTAKP